LLGFPGAFRLNATAPGQVPSRRRLPNRDPRESAEALLGQLDQLWGTEAMAQLMVASRADDARFRRWFAKAARSSASPRAAQAFLRAMFEIDARPLLPLIHAPTLVLHRTGYPLVPIEHGHYLADHIQDAKLIELPGSDGALPYQAIDLTLDHVEEFLGGLHRPPAPARVLATVLFTDIVASTEQASRLGDRRWRQLLDVHDELAHRLVEEFQGQLIKTTGDGILATFDGPDGDPLHGRTQRRAARDWAADPGWAAHWRGRATRR
jgi:hypothetical protein